MTLLGNSRFTAVTTMTISFFKSGISAYLCFILFLFFLPLYEAPKNIFSIFFLVSVGFQVFLNPPLINWFRQIHPAIFPFLFLFATPFFAGIGSPYLDFSQRFFSALNWALMPCGALIVLLVNFPINRFRWAMRIFSFGTLAAIVQAFIAWQGIYPEINSVGHVNQSALYAAFCLVPATMLLMIRSHMWDSILAFVVVVAVFAYQAPARSLVGFATAATLLGGLWSVVCIYEKWLKTLLVSLMAGLVVVGSLVVLPAQYFGPYESFKRELDNRIDSETDPFSNRDRLVRTAVEVAGGSFTGFGLGSFGVATDLSIVERAVVARGVDWSREKSNYFTSSHGHNLFANLLVERGWLGILSVGSSLVFLLVIFCRNFYCPFNQIGFLTIVSLFLAGLGQSTLHVEHGQLALICLALCVDLSRKQKSARKG